MIKIRGFKLELSTTYLGKKRKEKWASIGGANRFFKKDK